MLIGQSVPQDSAMLYTQCTYEDCRVPFIIAGSDIPGGQGTYACNCPVCRRSIRFGVVSRFLPINPSGGARGPSGRRHVGPAEAPSSNYP